jgi:prepilin-type N-terminal cleavage/methylation domain-containing protein/prepilin-type processing-associated H-X9-DG protein
MRFSKKGFTLIELLVAIGMIAMLIAMLMPALVKARHQGKEVVCLNNLRQMAVAAQNYAATNNDHYPSAYLNDPDPMDSMAVQAFWDFTYTKNWDTLEEDVRPGLLWQGDTIEKVQHCPSYKGPDDLVDPYTGYNYNTSFIGSNGTVPIPTKTSQVARPAGCALFGDGYFYNDRANKFVRSPFKSDRDNFAFRASGTQGYRHSGKTDVAFCDGHVSPQREIFTETVTEEKEKIEQYNLSHPGNKTGFLSADNSAYDLK